MSASPSVSPVSDLPLAGNADDDPGMSQIRASGRGSTLKRAIFGVSDDNLTDLSDTDAESDNGDADSNADSDADADVGDEESDEDIKPAKKKAKTGPSGSKAKALSKGKAKVGAGKTKGKGKAKSKGKGKKKGVKKTKTPKVDPVDGRLIARRPEWGDIPDWEGKEGSYLMGMPADIMDKCFGLGQDLALRDYLALAGTCRYFRQFLDDDFFHHLWHKRGKTSNSSLAYKIGARDKTKQIRDPDSKDEDPKWLSVPNVPDHPPGEKPFSRTVKDIYSAPGDCCIANTDKKGRFLHYVPRLSRKKWTREQYTVYKEEKREFYLSAVKRTKKKIKAVDAEMAGLRRTKQRWETVHINGVNRHVLATVEGRRDGEKAVKKDDKGLPLAADSDGEGDSDNDGTLIARRGQLGNGETGEPRRVRKMRLNQQLKADIAKAVKAEEWGVPDTDEETDEVVQEFKSLRVRKYDEYGHAVVHDCWPSQWRAIIAEEVRESKINLTTAMRDYHVQRSELITLKHWLVSNPMSTTTPQQTFSRAAVEALAFRSHGGAEGHAAHLANQERKAKDREQAKKDKIAEAKKNGTYVKPKWRPPRFPTYVFAERKAVGCQYILGHRHCQCEACMDFGNEECSGCSTCEDENSCHSCGNVHWG